jgi:hypothetical protein
MRFWVNATAAYRLRRPTLLKTAMVLTAAVWIMTLTAPVAVA